MKYSIQKEEKPDKTISLIKNILADIGIHLNEQIKFQEMSNSHIPWSCHLTLPDMNFIYSNGKGTSLHNAMASGYGEFIERLQNGIYFCPPNHKKYYFSPDEKLILKSNIKKNIINRYFPDNSIVKNLLKISDIVLNSTNKKIVGVPFYNLNNKQIYYLPIKLLHIIQGSNGMASGNTDEEALVQGICEICERFALKKILTGHLTMPDIPSEIYNKYEKLKGLIDFYQKNGLKLTIKDASAGENLPVACVLLEDKANNVIYIHFGSHPNLAVSIERCLTEFAQGVNFKDLYTAKKYSMGYFSKLNYNFNKKYPQYIYETVTLGRTPFEYNEELYNQLFKNKPDYEFSKSHWIDSDNHIPNKKLLKILLNQIEYITQNDIYIRNSSFLGFPSFYIFIPSMSVVSDYDLSRSKQEINLLKWINFDKENIMNQSYTLKSLLNAIEYRILNSRLYEIYQISELPNEYLGLLCAIALNNTEKIIKFTELTLEKNLINTSFLSLIKDYYLLKKENKKLQKDFIINKYGQNDFYKLIFFKKNINFERIKLLILRNKCQQQKQQKDIIRKNRKFYNNIRQKIFYLYEKNIPIQNSLNKITFL